MMGSLFAFPFGSSSSHSQVAWAQNPAQLVTQTRGALSDASSGKEKISLRTLIETRCPSVLTPFRAARGLFNGHLQTGYAVVGDFTREDPVVYDRKLLKLKDGGTLGVDFTPLFPSGRVFQDTTPVVVALHGLTGGSHESYVRNIIAPAIAPVDEGGLGYRAVVVNSRGCAGVPLTSPQFYGIAHTDDFRQAMYYIAHMYPNAPLLGLGFSLGANILTRYVAEEGESCRLVSACALAVYAPFDIFSPWDAVKTAHSLEANWFTRTAYAKSLGTNLKNVVARHADAIQQFPDSSLARALPALLGPDASARLTLRQFDTLVSIHCGGSSPPFPFADEWAYYVYGSSHDKLDAIRVPFLAINSDDDPIVRWVPADYDRNEWVTVIVTRGGGHMGWFQSVALRNAGPGGLRSSGSRRRRVHGWLVEAGKEHLGCQEIGDGGTIQAGTGERGDLLAGL
ncbi:AB-hydrolase YheT [Russula brevipes]|nr:AB-hydrolase YheT [Russula brevipes]